MFPAVPCAQMYEWTATASESIDKCTIPWYVVHLQCGVCKGLQMLQEFVFGIVDVCA